MRCEVCGAEFPQEAAECPNCGMPTSYTASNPLEEPATRAREAVPSPTPALIQVVPLPDVVQPAPHGPRHRAGGARGALLVALSLLLIIAGGGVGYYFFVVQPAAHNDQVGLTGASGMTPNAATVQAEATIAASAPDVVYRQSVTGVPTVQDPLNASNASAWKEYTGANGNCAFTGGAYHINSLHAGLTTCFYPARTFGDFALQVHMTIVRGDAGGVVFRVPNADALSLNAYAFIVNVLGDCSLALIQNGEYTSLATRTCQTINKGVNQPAVLTVIARGNTLLFFVNQQHIMTIQNNTFSNGMVGLLSLSFQDATEVTFHQAQIWAL